MTGDDPRSRGRLVISAACLLLGTILLVPTGHYSYLNIDPPAVGPGDLYFGDGTGFVIALFFGVPALVLLAIGALLLRRPAAVARVAPTH